MVNFTASNAVDPRSDQTKDYIIGIYFFLRKTYINKEKDQKLVLGIMVVCPSGAVCCSNELSLCTQLNVLI